MVMKLLIESHWNLYDVVDFMSRFPHDNRCLLDFSSAISLLGLFLNVISEHKILLRNVGITTDFNEELPATTHQF